MTTTFGDLDTMEHVTTDPVTGNDKPRCSHIVHKPESEPDESDHAYVFRARIEEFPVTALCGYTWVPQRSTAGLPVCAECKDIWDSLPDDGEGWVKSNG